jgi:hypothetical protein
LVLLPDVCHQSDSVSLILDVQDASSGPSLPVPMSSQLLAILGRSIAADGEENTPGPHLGSVDDKSTSPR